MRLGHFQFKGANIQSHFAYVEALTKGTKGYMIAEHFGLVAESYPLFLKTQEHN